MILIDKNRKSMSVIRKLSLYLNNLFEDDGNRKRYCCCKTYTWWYINDLIGDDLDKLIAEFSNK